MSVSGALPARLIIVYWRDIPSQVIAERGRGRRREIVRLELTSRFAEAIDAAAMRDGATESDAYLEGWRRSDPTDCPDMPASTLPASTLDDIAQHEAARLEAAYDSDRLRTLIHQGGADHQGNVDLQGSPDLQGSGDRGDSGQSAAEIGVSQPSR